jgi:hypothetical protein
MSMYNFPLRLFVALDIITRAKRGLIYQLGREREREREREEEKRRA